MDNRSHPRVAVDRHIPCEAGGSRALVFLYDLSLGGCMVEADDAAWIVGQEMTLVLASAPYPGKVVWAIGSCVGVQFAQHLHAAIVEHYGFIPTALQFEDIVPRDKFGRPLPPLSSVCK
jgi:hypothetical protein